MCGTLVHICITMAAESELTQDRKRDGFDRGGMRTPPLADAQASPYDRFAIHCPGCGEHLQRIDLTDEGTTIDGFSARCSRCEVVHTKLSTVAVASPADTDDTTPDPECTAEDYRAILDIWWTRRVRTLALDGEERKATDAAHFWNTRSYELGWEWTPPAELALGSLDKYTPTPTPTDSDSSAPNGSV